MSSLSTHDRIRHSEGVESSLRFDMVIRMIWRPFDLAYQLCHVQVHCVAVSYRSPSVIMAIQNYAQQPLIPRTNAPILNGMNHIFQFVFYEKKMQFSNFQE